MNKRIILITLLAYAYMNTIQAICYEKLNLKNGLIVEGNILSQKPGKTVSFSIERAMVTIDSEWIERSSQKTQNKSELEDIWKEYIEECIPDLQASEYTFSNIRILDISRFSNLKSDKSKLVSMLNDIYNGRIISSMILEEGSNVKFASVNSDPIEYTFNISDIHSIEYREPDELALNGVEEEIKTKNDTYRGFIKEKILGECIRMKTNNGRYVNISNSDIVWQKKHRLNKILPLYKQVPFLDEIEASEEIVLKGVISFQFKNKSESYVLLTDTLDMDYKYESKKIMRINRIRNTSYLPLTEFVVDNDSVYFNRHAVEAIEVEKDKRDEYSLEEDKVEKIYVLYADEIDGKLKIELKDNEVNNSFILSPITDIGTLMRKKFSYKMEDILLQFVQPIEKYVTKSGTLSLIYEVQRGGYILFNRKSQKTYFCIIE